jgi:hypothetical protein
MADSDKPIDGEIIGPGEQGAGGKQPPAKRLKPISFNRNQSEEQREDEKKRTEPFQQVVILGRGWWDRDGFEPTEEQRGMVKMLKFSGYTDEDVASGLHMSVETLIKHFAHELKHAKMLLTGDLATRAYTRARRGNDILTMFLLKTRGDGNFSEKAAVATAITDSLKDVDALSDDKKAQVIASLVDLMNPRKEKPKKEDAK